MAVGEVVAGLKLVSEGVKAIAGIADSIQNADVKKVTIDMGNHVLSLQTQMLDLVNEHAILQEENRNLKSQLVEKVDFDQFTGNLYYEKNVYWLMDQSDNAVDAYCPSCVDGKRLKMKLASKFKPGHGMIWQCHHCKFEVDLTEPPKRDEVTK
jgi:hypothetical protein